MEKSLIFKGLFPLGKHGAETLCTDNILWLFTRFARFYGAPGRFYSVEKIMFCSRRQDLRLNVLLLLGGNKKKKMFSVISDRWAST
jgi:hypothetical protein